MIEERLLMLIVGVWAFVGVFVVCIVIGGNRLK